MKGKELFDEMTDLLKALGYRIRKDNGTFNGGACILRDERLIVLNKNLPMEIHLSILANVLFKHKDEIYIKPKVREFIEKEGGTFSETIEIIVKK